MMDAPETSGLARLEAAIARDFALLNHPPADWVPPRHDRAGRRMADVAIIGGGMCGLAAAFALRRLGISNIAHVDRAETAHEGPWITYARMRTLRSPKHLTGPSHGMANLTFRAWWEAQARDWERLDRIGRADWMDYLTWYRRVTGAQVRNRVGMIRIEPGAAAVTLSFEAPEGTENLTARRVVLATGREGQAAPRVPAPLAPFLGAEVSHSSHPMPEVRGRRIAVIGLAASAFDNAATALEGGAAEVSLIGRSDGIPRLNKMKQTVYPGFTHGFPDLPDAQKLRLLDHVMSHRIAPPRASVQRISSDPRTRLLLGAAVLGARRTEAGLVLDTAKGQLVADAVILGTGFAVDLSVLGEIGCFAEAILRWGDRVPEARGEWAELPYLGPGFEFLSREGSEVPGLGRLHCFTHASQLSLGNLSNDIPAVSEGADRLARAIASALYVEDSETHWERMLSYDDPELLGDEWPGVDAWSPPVS